MTVPKYYIISQNIVQQIRSGRLKPGMRIPSENDIIRTYHVSNTTARKSLQEIVNAGWALKIKGKGTFVQKREIERSVTRILSFSKNMIEAGKTPSTRLLESGMMKEGYSQNINGRRYSMKDPVLKIRRLRYADKIPMMLEIRYISMSICPGIERKNLELPLYDIYEGDYNLKLKQVDQMIQAMIISDVVTEELFEVSEPIPAFLVDGVSFCGQDVILEMERSIYRGDKYRFSVRAT